ncbi:MAG: hypothetical protein WCR07_03090 [Verrucomicrobiota bacterium]|jgi:hypothetical protein
MPAAKSPPEAGPLARVVVSPIAPHEREDFDRPLKEDHYLHQPHVAGPTLRYVALLLFSSAALHIKARDPWIGRSPCQRDCRLGDDWAQRQLAALGVLPDKDGVRRSPSDSTFGRVLAACEVRELVAIIGQWLREQEPAAVARLAVDGKTLRGGRAARRQAFAALLGGDAPPADDAPAGPHQGEDQRDPQL